MLVGVKINGKGKIEYYDSNNLDLKENLTVLVDTDKGLQYALVCSILPNTNDGIEYNKVVRITTKKDYIQHLSNLKDAKEAINKCMEFVRENNLDMSIIDAEYTFTRSQLQFKFVADNRVDFRQLAKELGAYFKTRIELRQVGIRDKAKEIGGLGPCGRRLCCSSFLNEFESVSINMAKNQLLSLNPTKINGVCGRLLCCLNYENDTYTELRKNLPEVGEFVKTKNGEGKVTSIDLLNQSYTIIKDDNTVVVEEVSK